ncbi:nucleotidyl transferase AbiEii/AbiGii toxin family protein [Mycoplasma procyoni]|uniref:nucleotidyl transferase AbiEii/AbiGii toxin family protein n=1 Tax=Mycoplasma procyoni TaxID=568784 RepID=UPI00197C0EE7|nr:nucleotidyl transferase AbiEii/AbiGii toxin family protein [Mycoplasma procyoni]MBN3534578.1 nucleotidyl transferase AbiEii/AbiGii toxin family protein [Mycoplasma procyoni]
MKQLTIQNQKQDFMNFIIYKIFSSQFKQNFILEGSNALLFDQTDSDLENETKLFYRFPKDIDFNLKDIEKNNKLFKIMTEIFKNEKDITLKINEQKYEEDNYNVVQMKISSTKTGLTITVNVDLVYEDNEYEVITKNITYNDKIFSINTYSIEKYCFNKIEYLLKNIEGIKGSQFRVKDNNFIKYLLDFSWLIVYRVTADFKEIYSFFRAKNVHFETIATLFNDIIDLFNKRENVIFYETYLKNNKLETEDEFEIQTLISHLIRIKKKFSELF